MIDGCKDRWMDGWIERQTGRQTDLQVYSYEERCAGIKENPF